MINPSQWPTVADADRLLAVFWDDLVVWYQNNNVLNYNNGILKFLPINKSTMCTLYVFIDIFVIDHLNKPVRMLVLSDV